MMSVVWCSDFCHHPTSKWVSGIFVLLFENMTTNYLSSNNGLLCCIISKLLIIIIIIIIITDYRTWFPQSKDAVYFRSFAIFTIISHTTNLRTQQTCLNYNSTFTHIVWFLLKAASHFTLSCMASNERSHHAVYVCLLPCLHAKIDNH